MAGALGISLQVAVLAALARKRMGLDLNQLVRGSARALLVALLAGVAAWAADVHIAQPLSPWMIEPALLPLAAMRAVRLAIAGTVWLAVLLVAGGLLEMPGMPKRLVRLASRLRRARPPVRQELSDS